MTEGGYAVLRELPSTHLLGRRIAREYALENAAAPTANLLAWRQSAGQGREGRSWSSPPGGVYATLVRTLPPTADFQPLPLLVATALCEALNFDLGGRCAIKWPNDLLVDGRKLGGILIDATRRGDEPDLAVISFGVNHARLEEAGATSLEREAPGRVRLAELAVRLVAAVDEALARDLPPAEIVGRYRRLSVHRAGDALRYRHRGDQIEGVFQGFDRRGFLRLRVGDEERLLTAGELAHDAAEPLGPHPYFMAIEDVFLDLRGSPLALPPKDWLIAKEWFEEGIPLELVERTVREIFARRETGKDEERQQKVWSLSYCKRAVKAAWRRQQELQAPGAGGDEEELDLAARLANLAASLPSDLAGREAVAEQIRALDGDAETIEGRLAELDREVFHRAAQALSPADAEAVERELAASRAALVERLPADELERAGERLREEILRRRLDLAVLSLFAPEALVTGQT